MIQAADTFVLPSVSLNTNPTFAETQLAASRTADSSDSGSANLYYGMNCKMHVFIFSIT